MTVEYKLLVAGGRDFSDETRLTTKLFDIAEEAGSARSVSLVSGMARGADMLGYQFAQREGVLCYSFPADWDGLGKRAGFVRNKEMGDFCDGALIYWDGASKGTKHMIDYLQRLGKPVIIERY